ncbi:glycosyltransferase [Synoicihabitans lomoniglobus]|nr:glycosyltransferase [Opitutaceae bacterium LMO-M01]
MDLSGKKILICEEALIDQKGHFQTWIRAIRQMHLDAGAQVFVAGNEAVVDDVRSDLAVLPIYTVNSWDQKKLGSLPAWRRHFRVFAQNWRIFWQTRKALRAAGPVDALFFTAVRVHHLIGLRLLCMWGLGHRFKKLTCFLLTSQAEYNADFTSFQFPRRSGLIALVLKSFKRLVERGSVILAGDSHITCAEYEKLTNIPMTLFPSPGSDLRYVKTAPTKGATVFTLLGVSTWDKGIDNFQSSILKFLERNPESQATFVLQWSVPCQRPDGSIVEVSEKLRSDHRVTYLERRLSNEEYATYFRDADFIVLPYRKMTYFNRISGVAVEAAVSGKPMIVTESTWLEWAVNEFGSGIAVPEGGIEELCAAIERCCEERDSILARARERMAVARDYNSSERYLSLLW